MACKLRDDGPAREGKSCWHVAVSASCLWKREANQIQEKIPPTVKPARVQQTGRLGAVHSTGRGVRGPRLHRQDPHLAPPQGTASRNSVRSPRRPPARWDGVSFVLERAFADDGRPAGIDKSSLLFRWVCVHGFRSSPGCFGSVPKIPTVHIVTACLWWASSLLALDARFLSFFFGSGRETAGRREGGLVVASPTRNMRRAPRRAL